MSYHPWLTRWTLAGYVKGSARGVGADTYSARARVASCGVCGAVVEDQYQDLHEQWHSRQEMNP